MALTGRCSETPPEPIDQDAGGHADDVRSDDEPSESPKRGDEHRDENAHQRASDADDEAEVIPVHRL